MNDRVTKSSSAPLGWITEIAGAAVVFVCAYLTAFIGTDYPPHVKIAMRLDMYDLPHLFQKHSEPVWHLSTRILRYILDCEPALAGALVSGFFLTAAYLVSCYYLRRECENLDRTGSALLALVFHLVSAIYVPFFNKFPYLGQGSPNIWHNPTQIALRPFMMLFLCIEYPLIEQARRSDFKKLVPLKTGILLAAVLIMTNLSKPSFVMVYFPGIFFLMVYWFIRYRMKNFMLTVSLAAICIPSAALMLTQYLFIFVSDEGKGGGIAIMPFVVAGAYTPNIVISLILLLAFPLCMFVIALKRKMTDAGNELTMCMLLAGLLERFLLAETGTRMYHGNFGWGYQASVTMFFFIAIRDYARIFADKKNRRGAEFILAALLLALHLVSGIYYLYYMIVLRHKL